MFRFLSIVIVFHLITPALYAMQLARSETPELSDEGTARTATLKRAQKILESAEPLSMQTIDETIKAIELANPMQAINTATIDQRSFSAGVAEKKKEIEALLVQAEALKQLELLYQPMIADLQKKIKKLAKTSSTHHLRVASDLEETSLETAEQLFLETVIEKIGARLDGNTNSLTNIQEQREQEYNELKSMLCELLEKNTPAITINERPVSAPAALQLPQTATPSNNSKEVKGAFDFEEELNLLEQTADALQQAGAATTGISSPLQGAQPKSGSNEPQREEMQTNFQIAQQEQTFRYNSEELILDDFVLQLSRVSRIVAENRKVCEWQSKRIAQAQYELSLLEKALSTTEKALTRAREIREQCKKLIAGLNQKKELLQTLK